MKTGKTYPFVMLAGLTPGRRRACQPFSESAVDTRNVVKASSNGWTVWPMDASIVGGPLFSDTEKSPFPVKARKVDTSLWLTPCTNFSPFSRLNCSCWRNVGI